MSAIQIGTVTITEAFEVTQTWETASNYTVHEVQPGTYPVSLTTGPGSTWVLVTVDTIVKQNYYVNRVFSASSAHDERPNTPGSYTFQLRDYHVAEAALADDPTIVHGSFELLPTWRVVVEHMTLYTGERHTARSFQPTPVALCGKCYEVLKSVRTTALSQLVGNCPTHGQTKAELTHVRVPATV